MKTVIFDLDGTLICSHEDVWDCLEIALEQQFGLDLPAEVREDNRLLARTGAEILRMVFPQATDADCKEYVRRVHHIYTQECSLKKTWLYPGMNALLRDLFQNGYRLFVVTMKPEESAHRILHEKSVESLFAGVYSPDSFSPAHLPKAEIFARLAAQFNLRAENCVTVGDSVTDIVAAHTTGLPGIAVTWGYTDGKTLAQNEAEGLADTARACGDLISHLLPLPAR